MDKHTLHAFFDEMKKIAGNVQMPVFQSAPLSPQPEMNAQVRPNVLEDKDGSWRQKVTTKSGDYEIAGKPAREANNLFGLPLGVRRRLKREYEDPNTSSAQSADRAQSPIDGQGTTNTSGPSNNTFFGTSTGPGGV